MSALSLLALLLGALVCLPCAVLALECLAACLPRRAGPPPPRSHPRTAVLVPAHDEEASLAAALLSIRPELAPGDRLLVVAHNCGDGTAAVARAAGAEVLEVRDAGLGGKPDAVKAGLRELERDPPQVVVIVDADCRAAPGAVRALADAAAAHGSPVQGEYRFAAGEESATGRLSSLAVLLKNVVRPTGLHNLGWPCLLNGAGSAYPFEQLRAAPHGEGSIAEDYQLAIDLALRGQATRFVPGARIESVLPARSAPALRQRRRWEHGHLRLALVTAPGLVLRGLGTGRPQLLCLGLDLCVPPLAFLVLAWLGVLLLSALDWSLGGSAASAGLVAGAGVLLATGVLTGLWRFAGARAALDLVWRLPVYLAWKAPLYLAFLVKRETRWRKTERT
jgi:cellulose synthase/poly-beta-1,6-N-acetylglucosamine synthase-like glycosyltransferase